MDINTAWNNLLVALGERNLDNIETYCEACIKWLAKGGFAPRISTWQRCLSETQLLHYLQDLSAVAESQRA